MKAIVVMKDIVKNAVCEFKKTAYLSSKVVLLACLIMLIYIGYQRMLTYAGYQRKLIHSERELTYVEVI